MRAAQDKRGSSRSRGPRRGAQVAARSGGAGVGSEEFRGGSLETAGPQTKGSQNQYGPPWDFVILSCPGLTLQIKKKKKI